MSKKNTLSYQMDNEITLLSSMYENYLDDRCFGGEVESELQIQQIACDLDSIGMTFSDMFKVLTFNCDFERKDLKDLVDSYYYFFEILFMEFFADYLENDEGGVKLSLKMSHLNLDKEPNDEFYTIAFGENLIDLQDLTSYKEFSFNDFSTNIEVESETFKFLGRTYEHIDEVLLNNKKINKLFLEEFKKTAKKLLIQS